MNDRIVDIPSNVRVEVYSRSVYFKKINYDELFIRFVDYDIPLSSYYEEEARYNLTRLMSKYGEICSLYLLKSKYHYFGQYMLRFKNNIPVDIKNQIINSNLHIKIEGEQRKFRVW
jgi:hypothetical protein